MISSIFAILFCVVLVIIIKIGLLPCRETQNTASAFEKATLWQKQILKMPVQEGAIEQQKWRNYVNSIHIRKNNIRSV